MLNLLEVNSIVFITNKDAYCVFIAFFFDLFVELCELLVQTLRASLVDSRSIEDVDDTFCFTKQPCCEGSLLLRLRPESELCLSLSLAWKHHLLRVVVNLLCNRVACVGWLHIVR